LEHMKHPLQAVFSDDTISFPNIVPPGVFIFILIVLLVVLIMWLGLIFLRGIEYILLTFLVHFRPATMIQYLNVSDISQYWSESSTKKNLLKTLHKTVKSPIKPVKKMGLRAQVLKNSLKLNKLENDEYTLSLGYNAKTNITCQLYWNVEEDAFNKKILQENKDEETIALAKEKQTDEEDKIVSIETKNGTQFIQLSHLTMKDLKADAIKIQSEKVALEKTKKHEIKTVELPVKVNFETLTTEFPSTLEDTNEVIIPLIMVLHTPALTTLSDVVNTYIILQFTKKDESYKVKHFKTYFQTYNGLFFHEEIYHHDDECVVCITDPPQIITIPCQHQCVCLECFQQLDKCPICRKQIDCYIIDRSVKIEDYEDDDQPQA